MKRLFPSLTLAGLLFVGGCSSINPGTGKPEYDPVKTEKVQSVIKPAIATAVLLAIRYEPKSAPGFAFAQLTTCDLASRQIIDPAEVSEALLGLDISEGWTADARLGFQIGVSTALGIYNAALADRFRADVGEDAYALAILETLCDGFELGLEQAKAGGLIP